MKVIHHFGSVKLLCTLFQNPIQTNNRSAFEKSKKDGSRILPEFFFSVFFLQIKKKSHTKLAGGESAGFPMGVTYAEESPPSTAKSVPFKKNNNTESEKERKRGVKNAYRYVATVFTGH